MAGDVSGVRGWEVEGGAGCPKAKKMLENSQPEKQGQNVPCVKELKDERAGDTCAESVHGGCSAEGIAESREDPCTNSCVERDTGKSEEYS
jgi:hypothetical protein